VSENIKDGELLYSYGSSYLILKYKNGYDSVRIGNVKKDNILYGNQAEPEADIPAIEKAGKAYLLMYHTYFELTGDYHVWNVLDALRERGYVDRVIDVSETPLYWYASSLDDIKTSAEIIVFALSVNDGVLSCTVRVRNTGETILESENRGAALTGAVYPVVLRADTGEQVLRGGNLSAPLLPGESADIDIVTEQLPSGDYEIDLVSDGRYSFSLLGMPIVTVHVS